MEAWMRSVWVCKAGACVLVGLIAGGLPLGIADDTVRRGAELGNSPTVDLKRVLAAPEVHLGRAVIVEGKVDKVCQTKGCWLELIPADESRGVRVTFEDYGFFVPKDSKGWMARLEGRFVREQLSKREVDHLLGEGATLARQPDGTAAQVSFVARAVELRPTAEEKS
ncbi:MAG: DUF4920 domain-containing protein [Gammaproteobacteria bacterium]|nr:DUF4920 domain-containing protein [Gammaproteobacteria bacterium]